MHGAWVGIPAWLVHGLALGLLASLAVAPTFVAGVRVLPGGTGGSPGEGGASRRRAEIRGYLRAIDEHFVEDRGVGGVPAAAGGLHRRPRGRWRPREAGDVSVRGGRR